MEIIIQRCPSVVSPESYEGLDEFCFILSSIFRRFSEHYGLIKGEEGPNELNQYQFILEKLEFFERQQDLLLKVKSSF